MLPFYEKKAAEGDAPEYEPTTSDEQKCGTCRFFRPTDDDAGYCDKYKFICQDTFVCSSWEPGELSKLSSLENIPLVGEAAKEIQDRGVSAVEIATDVARGDISPRTLKKLRKGKLLPKRISSAIKGGEDAVGLFYSKKEASLRGFTGALDPISMDPAVAGVDAERAGVGEDEHKINKRLAVAGGVLGGGILAPTLTGAVLGGAKGALQKGSVLRRLTNAAREAGRSSMGLYRPDAIPALVAGAGLGGLGAGRQYDTGRSLAILADSVDEEEG